MRTHNLVTASLSLTLVTAACGPTQVDAPGELLKSSKARITATAPEADQAQAVHDTTTFALDLYRKLPASADNAVLSPWSITSALSMTYPGARGATQTAFETVLHQSLTQERYHRAMNSVSLALDSRSQGAKDFQLRANNQLFTQTGMTVVPAFLDVLGEEYGAGVRLLDFATQPEPSRKAINQWIDANTAHLIPELLKQGAVTSDTRLALVNTLYFNAKWKTPFEHSRTANGTFTLGDGSTMQVPMMAGEGLAVRQATVDSVLALELPYKGDEVAMLVLAPPVGTLAQFEQSLDAAKLRSFVDALTEGTAAVRMPKFEARSQADLKEVLTALGLGVAFTPNADFTGMQAEGGLAITAVVHEAVVKTDEAGTEAAAATAVIVGRVSLPQYVEVDRPFLYLIRDRATGVVLFLGRVTRP